jgi:hypothetical protein
MHLATLCEHAASWLMELSNALQASARVEELEARVSKLESQANTAPPAHEPSPEATYTHNPETWPTRQNKSELPFPDKGKKEYTSDTVDLKIVMAVLRHDPNSWGDVRKQIAAIRRLTLQQVAELKARITRGKLLEENVA